MPFCRTYKAVIAFFLISIFAAAPVLAHDQPVKTTVVEGRFVEILSAVKQAIQGRGINIAHTLPASAMLSRTGPAYGINDHVYAHAESIEFCSAKISHKLAKANPENIILCPFTISVYVLSSDPEHVRLSYRVPFTREDDASQEAITEMEELVSGIVAEAADW
ncbi:MAG: DUF302 domain-containing protein [Chromatiales bacterium]|jgi:uncharacterized protein (DUF302 family)